MIVSVYILYKAQFNKSFPKLLETVTSRGIKVLVQCTDMAQARECDVLLFSFEQLSFLPHAVKGDVVLTPQAIYITDDPDDNPYCATVLACYDQGYLSPTLSFERILYMLEPTEAYGINRLKDHYLQHGIEVTILQQQQDGSWKQ